MSKKKKFITAEGTKADWNTIITLLPYLWPKEEKKLRLRFIWSLLFLVLAKAINVTVPLFYKESVDALTQNFSTIITVPVALLIAYGAARVLSQTFGELRDAIFAKVLQKAIRDISQKTFKHLHQLSLKFHLSRKTGGVSQAIERGTRGIEFLLGFMAFSIIPTLLEVLFVCIILWTLYDFWFAGITFFTITSYIIWTFSITEWRIKLRRAMNQADSDANTKVVDSLLNFETVKYFTNEKHEEQRYDESLKIYEAASIKSRTTLSLLNIGQGIIVSLGLTIVMIIAGFGVKNETMTVGDFVLVNAYLIQLFIPLSLLGMVYREIKQSLIDMEKLFQLNKEKEDVKDKVNAKTLMVNGGEILFNNVSFSYDGSRQILNNISFRVPAGKTIAIVGPSGSGKSTISKLLYRFYNINSGSISIDGQNICDVTQNSLRSSIGIVPQDTVLFNDTIFYNIAYGKPGSNPKIIKNAARMAQIHEFITSLPDGYESMVGERGLKLSGGEKQRVAIARTILKDPPILLFDEATSALDTLIEREIQLSLDQVSKNNTTLIIAHRLSTVINADEIIVIKEGNIIERGTHKFLINADGEYALMWRHQQEAAEAKNALIIAERKINR